MMVVPRSSFCIWVCIKCGGGGGRPCCEWVVVLNAKPWKDETIYLELCESLAEQLPEPTWVLTMNMLGICAYERRGFPDFYKRRLGLKQVKGMAGIFAGKY